MTGGKHIKLNSVSAQIAYVVTPVNTRILHLVTYLIFASLPSRPGRKVKIEVHVSLDDCTEWLLLSLLSLPSGVYLDRAEVDSNGHCAGFPPVEI